MSVTIFSMNIFLLYPEASSRVDILRLLSLFLHHSCYCDIPEKKCYANSNFFLTIPLEWLVQNFPKLSLILNLMNWMRSTIHFARINVNFVHFIRPILAIWAFCDVRRHHRFSNLPFVCLSVSYCVHNRDVDPIYPLFCFETKVFDYFWGLLFRNQTYPRFSLFWINWITMWISNSF